MNDEYLSVVSEINELKNLIALTPEENVIERMSLESRLQVVNELSTKLLNEKWPKD